jgi:hypothetical protein
MAKMLFPRAASRPGIVAKYGRPVLAELVNTCERPTQN